MVFQLQLMLAERCSSIDVCGRNPTRVSELTSIQRQGLIPDPSPFLVNDNPDAMALSNINRRML
jgi:hypothetical protein